MKTKNKIFTSAVLAVILTAFGITVNAQIVVGIAYKSMFGSECRQFKEAYSYYYTSRGENIPQMSTDVKSNLMYTALVGERDIMIHSTYEQSVAAILTYKKPISGYPCIKNAYAVGFGDNRDEAYNDAVREMRLHHSGNEVGEVRYVER